ncbi:MAG TPA: copper chaperone PCu(A)C [Aestuariivirgaceae bacterium]|jgi:hypothetical protein
MRLRTFIEVLLALILTFAAVVAISRMAKASGITVANAFARASLAGAGAGAVYLTLRNDGPEPDRLRSVAAAGAGRAEIHRHVMDNDIAAMARVSCIVIPAGGEVAFAPGGLHVMLTDLASPLKEGTELELHLVFDRAGEITITVPVKSVVAGAEQQHAAPMNLEFCE